MMKQQNPLITIRISSQLILPLLACFLLVACAQVGQAGGAAAPTPTPLPTPVVPEKPLYTVTSGTVIRTLEFTGRVSPVREQELFFKSDGFVARVTVTRGDRVQAGDQLAELEIGGLTGRLAQQQLALETAESQLAKAVQDRADQLAEALISLEKFQLQLERAQAEDNRARFVSAQIKLDQARQSLVDAQDAYDTAWDPGREWELYMNEPSCLPGQGDNIPCTGPVLSTRLENERTGAERALASAQDGLTLAQTEYNDVFRASDLDDYDLQLLQKDIELAQLRVDQLRRDIDPQLSLNIEKARLDIVEIERQMADARLVAPFDGQILSASIRPGDSAPAFKTVMVLAEPQELEITAQLGSEDLGQMSLGQTATVRLRDRPEQDFAAHVRQLPYPFGGGTVETDESDTAVRIAFDDGDVALEMGELANVTIMLEARQDVLWLPPAALRTFQGRNFVVVQEEAGQRRVDVLLGIESDTRVEILEGLRAGQVVVGE